MLSWGSGQRVPNKSREERQQWWERDGPSTRLLILQLHRPPQDPLKSFSGLNCFELRFCHLIYEKPMPNYRGPNLGKVYAGHRQGRRQYNNCSSCTFWHNLHHRGCKGQSPNHVLRNHPDPGGLQTLLPGALGICTSQNTRGTKGSGGGGAARFWINCSQFDHSSFATKATYWDSAAPKRFEIPYTNCISEEH